MWRLAPPDRLPLSHVELVSVLSTATRDLVRSVSSLVAGATELVTAEAVLFHESVKRRAIDAREPGCLRHVRAGSRDQLRQVFLLEVGDELLLRKVEALGHDIDGQP